MIALVDIMDATSRQIYKQKKEALAQGDDAVLQEVGMGKDIMSILCEFLCRPFLKILSWSLMMRAILPVKANAMAAEGDRLPEEELIGQMRSVKTY